MPAKRRPGRPTLYTPERIKVILSTIKIGGTESDACARAGIDQDTLARWKKNNADFAESIEKARIDGKLARVNRIRHAGVKGQWQADAWYLERRWPEEYAQQLIVKVTAEQRDILKKFGYSSPSQAFEEFIRELALQDAEQSSS